MRYFLMFMALLVLGAVAHIARAADGMIGSLERHFQVTPGSTRVLQECGCTVRYIGTTVHGHRYTVTIDKLD